MIYFLALQHGINDYQLALYCQNTKISETIDNKTEVSRRLLTQIFQLLEQQKISINDISFIAINQGPGPFTTLRALITTVNGINFAKNIPLVGINGLHILLQEHKQENPVVGLLNAYNNDVYYAIAQKNRQMLMGCENIEFFLENLSQKVDLAQPITFIGQGTQLFSELILQKLHDKAILPDPMPQHCSLDGIALAAYQKWLNNEFQSGQILPLYLKELRYKAVIS